MYRQEGLHFYINLCNLNDVLLDEEERTKRINHSIHAMDVFFSSIERFSKSISNNIVAEKITGSRLHLYIVDELDVAYKTFRKISEFSYCLINLINNEIPKYNSIEDFNINIGADYGHFRVFNFETDDYSEITSIGYVANLAAKLQSRSEDNKISISHSIFEALSREEQKEFNTIFDKSLVKYNQNCYHSTNLSSIALGFSFSDAVKNSIKDYANGINLTDIDYAQVRKELNFKNLNTTQCKQLYGIPVFADVRGFTEQFNEDDSNLEEMTFKTQSILTELYNVSTKNGGIHVQFQGDRELTLFHNIPGQYINGEYQCEQTCFKSAVLASMRMVDSVKNYAVQIGVGEDFGKLFATKIGARGNKDNILLGETVIQADIMEDEFAGENQVIISNDIYTKLKTEDPFLAKQFTRIGEMYVTTVGYEQYRRSVSIETLKASNLKNDYNGAWHR